MSVGEKDVKAMVAGCFFLLKEPGFENWLDEASAGWKWGKSKAFLLTDDGGMAQFLLSHGERTWKY